MRDETSGHGWRVDEADEQAHGLKRTHTSARLAFFISKYGGD
eukprot:gene16893-19626_t